LAGGYEFTVDWFSGAIPVWKQIIDRYRPARVLEVGSYEGRSACFAIEQCAAGWPIELHCVDTWEGGVEHKGVVQMSDVERRFDSNIALAMSEAAHPVQFHKHKALSHDALARLMAEGQGGGFDVIYIDGSHQAPDVLSDAVLAFHLLKVDGVLIFDDYLWARGDYGQRDHYDMPKPAIDAFVNIYYRKVAVFSGPPLGQLYLRKVAP